MSKKVLVIGSGLGGICTAIRLAKAGYKVEIVEKYHQAGGRLNQLRKDGFIFDMAPTFFSMSYEFHRFAKECAIDMPFRFVELEPLYTVHFENKPYSVTIYKDIDKLAAQFAAFEPDCKKKIERYLADAKAIFDATIDGVVHKNHTSAASFIRNMLVLPPWLLPLMFRSMWKHLDRYFSSPELKIIMSLIAFFLGATPLETPAVYCLLNYVEMQHDGYYNVEGGMYKIVEGLLGEIQKRNINIHYNTEILSYSSRTSFVDSFTDNHGKTWKADIFVTNADAAWFRGAIMGRKAFSAKKLDNMNWTFAPFCIYAGIKGKIDQLQQHNYFLGDKFVDYAKTIFRSSNISEHPYYYVNVPSRHNAGVAPEGCEALFILCPVPDLRYKKEWTDRQAFADILLNDLSVKLGIDIRKQLVSCSILDPQQWEKMFNLYRGSGLGLGHNISQIAYFRPSNKDEKYNNLYYVGASTVPGTGLPMTIISSKLVTERILHEHSII